MMVTKLNNVIRIFKLIRPSLTFKATILIIKAKYMDLMDYASFFSVFLVRRTTTKSRFYRTPESDVFKLPKKTYVDRHYYRLVILHTKKY